MSKWIARLVALSFVAGWALIVSGIYMLIGTGWALIAGAVPLLLLAAIMARGMSGGK